MEELSPHSKEVLKKMRRGFDPTRTGIRYFEDLADVHESDLEVLLGELPRSRFDVVVEGADEQSQSSSAFEKLVGLVLSGVVDSSQSSTFTHSFTIDLAEGEQWIPVLVGKLKTEAAKLQNARRGDVAFDKLKFEFLHTPSNDELSYSTFEQINVEIRATTRS